jgi:hypothetical protein
MLLALGGYMATTPDTRHRSFLTIRLGSFPESGETSVSGEGGCETFPRMRNRVQLQDNVLQETGYLKHVTQDVLLDYFKLAQYMYRQYSIVVGEPHTYLQPELVHLMNQNQLHEATWDSCSLHNALKKEQDERDSKQIKENKEYLDLGTKQKQTMSLI